MRVVALLFLAAAASVMAQEACYMSGFVYFTPPVDQINQRLEDSRGAWVKNLKGTTGECEIPGVIPDFKSLFQRYVWKPLSVAQTSQAPWDESDQHRNSWWVKTKAYFPEAVKAGTQCLTDFAKCGVSLNMFAKGFIPTVPIVEADGSGKVTTALTLIRQLFIKSSELAPAYFAEFKRRESFSAAFSSSNAKYFDKGDAFVKYREDRSELDKYLQSMKYKGTCCKASGMYMSADYTTTAPTAANTNVAQAPADNEVAKALKTAVTNWYDVAAFNAECETNFGSETELRILTSDSRSRTTRRNSRGCFACKTLRR